MRRAPAQSKPWRSGALKRECRKVKRPFPHRWSFTNGASPRPESPISAEALPSTVVGAGRYAFRIRRSRRHARTIMAPRRIDAEAHRESRRLALVMLGQPAEPLAAFDVVRAKNARVVRRLGHLRRDSGEIWLILTLPSFEPLRPHSSAIDHPGHRIERSLQPT